MATIVNNPPAQISDNSGSGWAVAIIVLLIVVVGAILLWAGYHRAAPAIPGTANINVTLPSGGGGSSGGAAAPSAPAAPTGGTGGATGY